LAFGGEFIECPARNRSRHEKIFDEDKNKCSMLLVKPGQKHSSEKMLLLHTAAPLTPNRLLPAGLLLLFCPAKNCSGNCRPGTDAEKK
jgi:hypothetical protein